MDQKAEDWKEQLPLDYIEVSKMDFYFFHGFFLKKTLLNLQRMTRPAKEYVEAQINHS